MLFTEVIVLDKQVGILIELSMSKRNLSILDISGNVENLYLNTKRYYKTFISDAKSMLQNDLILPVVCETDPNNQELFVAEYYLESDYSLFENTYHIKIDFLSSLYTDYLSSLECVDSFELPDLTTEELRIVDELNESLFEI